MLAELLAVEPGGRAPIAGAHDEEDTLAAPRLRHGDFARVPADVRAIGNAGERCAPREWNHDGAIAWKRATRPAQTQALVARIKRKAPAPVEIQPLGALEIGTGVNLNGRWRFTFDPRDQGLRL